MYFLLIFLFCPPNCPIIALMSSQSDLVNSKHDIAYVGITYAMDSKDFQRKSTFYRDSFPAAPKNMVLNSAVYRKLFSEIINRTKQQKKKIWRGTTKVASHMLRNFPHAMYPRGFQSRNSGLTHSSSNHFTLKTLLSIGHKHFPRIDIYSISKLILGL